MLGLAVMGYTSVEITPCADRERTVGGDWSSNNVRVKTSLTRHPSPLNSREMVLSPSPSVSTIGKEELLASSACIWLLEVSTSPLIVTPVTHGGILSRSNV